MVKGRLIIGAVCLAGLATALIAEQKLEMLHLQVYALHAGGAATATPRPAAADGQDDDTGG